MDHELSLQDRRTDARSFLTIATCSETDCPAATNITLLVDPANEATIGDTCTNSTRFRRPPWPIAACILAAFSTVPGHAQVTQPKIVQKVVDNFSVERKTGRFAFSTPEQIRIGGSDDAALSVSYSPVDGTDFQQSGIPRLVYNQVRKEGTLNYYDYESVEFGSIGDSFRRDNANGPWINQYATGSSLVESAGHYIFTDKFGVQIDLSNDGTIVTYPDGRQIRYLGLSLSMSFEDRDRTKRSIVNNMGYMLKFVENGANHLDIQAINLTKDYCDATTAMLCAGLSKVRKASVDRSGGDRTLTDSVGGVTTYKFQQLYAFDYERICYFYDNNYLCPDPPSWYRWYPVSVALPDSTTPVFSLTYEKKGDVHDDIFVKTVQKGDLLATYNTIKSKYGTWGSNPYNLAFYIDTDVRLNGQLDNTTRSQRPLPEWGSARRFLRYSRDGLSRETKFAGNDLLEVAGTKAPEGNGEQLFYDTRFNVTSRVVLPKTGSGLPQQTTLFTFPSSCSPTTIAFCNKATSMTDPRGAITNYSYNSRGQILEETGPAPIVGAPRQRKIYTYDSRTAFILNAAGIVVPAGPPISLPVKMVTCDTTSSCLGGGTDTVTQYDYGPATGLNNLSLRGMSVTALDSGGNSQSRLTCYGYNYFGEKISETRPKSAQATCS